MKDPQNGLIKFFHIITHTKLANWNKSTEIPVDHHFIYLLGTIIISKGNIQYETNQYEAIHITVYCQLGLIFWSTDWLCLVRV